MDGGMESLGVDGDLLKTRDFHHPWSIPNITDEVLRILYPQIPTTDVVRFRSMLIVGKMESGKTSYFNALAVRAWAIYGRENVNIIPTNSTALGMQLFNKKPVQLIFVDDAIREQDCRGSMTKGQREMVKDYFEDPS